MPDFQLENHLDGSGYWRNLAEDVREGLTSTPRRLLPKYFYDDEGSHLFERITELPEYYPMKAEAALLREIAHSLMERLAPDEIVELGSGSSTKSRILLDAQPPAHPLRRYIPLDVSEAIVRQAAASLQRDYPQLKVHGVIGDFELHLHRLPQPSGRRLVLFLGSTIGNLHHPQRLALLRGIPSLLGRNGRLLLGVDLVKDTGVLERAYNDSAGVTAAFNRNILSVINKRLGADFQPACFRHEAFFNREQSRIEMHLRPSSPQTVTIAALGLTVELSPKETIWTESSYKFTRESTAGMLQAAGLQLEEWHAGRDQLFALALASKASGGNVD